MKKQINKKIISITQILILIVGILAFSYIVGEIGKRQGIEVSKGVGLVSAQPNLCDESGECTTEGGSCANSDECATGLICQEGICVDAPEIADSSKSITSPELSTKTNEPVRYEAGQKILSGSEKYQLQKEDVNKDGSLNEKEGSGIGNFAKNTGGQIVNGVLVSKGGEIIKGTGTKLGVKLFHTSYKSLGGSTIGGAVIGAVIGAVTAWALYKFILKADVRNMRNSGTAAIIAGAAGGVVVSAIIQSGAAVAFTGVGIVIAAAIFVLAGLYALFTFQNYSREVYSYIVTAWKAPLGGDYCDECNDLKYGCGEYQCRSFGKACEIVNQGTLDEACVWKDPKDIFPPVITALERVLLSEDYKYQPIPEKADTGVKIFYNKDSSGKGCVPPYTPLSLGIETDKYSDCKIDTERTPSYGEMTAPITRSEESLNEFVLDIPHVATPSVESQQASGIPDFQITNGQDIEFYIRCESANGYSNIDEYIMEFCVQDGPDVFPPVILGTNFLEDSFLQYNQSEAHFEIYTDEPAECKWSFEDLNYDAMQFDMDTCSQSEGDYLFSQFRYGCVGQLTGMKNRVENTVYIKCNDKPWWTEGDQGNRYSNEQSHVLNIKGTEPLVMDEITVNGKPSGAIIKDSVSTINIKLEAKAKFGAENGKSICQYEFGGNWIDFYNEGSVEFVNVNTQKIPLSEGFYNYSIRCFDAAGNSDKDNIEFTLEVDNTPPIVARAYYDVNNLKVITNEPAECVYTLQQNIGCAYNFEDGTAMSEIGELTHYTSWQAGKKYFIKCKDAFGNQPLPGQCSIIVKAFESY